MRLRRLAVAAVVASALAFAACSSGDDDDAASTSAPSTTAAPTTTTTAAVNASTGCGTTPAVKGLVGERPGDVELSFDSGGVARTYRLAVPDSYDADMPVPVILNLHGSGSNAIQQSVYSDLPRRAAERGVITITPDAIDGAWELAATGTDDDFLVALVRDVTDHYCIDLDRVYTAGISLGSWKATQEACTHPDIFAAIALVAEEVRPPDCAPMPVVAFHGTGDPVVPYGEGADPGITVTGFNGGLPGASVNMPSWAEGGGCGERQITPIGDDVEQWTYPDCDDGIDVVFYSIKGGGHTWPGSDINVGATTQTIDATDIALDFFAAHPMR